MDTKITNRKPIQPKTPEMETLLAAGYGMSIAEAREIIKTRAENPALVSLEDFRKAQAMLKAYESKAEVIDQSSGVRKD